MHILQGTNLVGTTQYKCFLCLFAAFLTVKDCRPRMQAGCWYLDYLIFGDFHYNAGGNALVADAVIKSLTQEPPVKRPKTTLRPQSGQGFGAHRCFLC